MQQLKTSPRGHADEIRAEGIVLVVYEDTDEKGVVHRANGCGNNDDTLPLDRVITVGEAIETFLKNMVRFDAVVDRVITRQLPQNQKDALGSRAFNKGVAGFTGLKDLIAAVNENDTPRVVQELVKGKNLRRRLRESLLYEAGEYRDLNMVGDVRYDVPMVPLYRTNPRTPGMKPEWIPMPRELFGWT